LDLLGDARGVFFAVRCFCGDSGGVTKGDGFVSCSSTTDDENEYFETRLLKASDDAGAMESSVTCSILRFPMVSN
jgi:hypothetical protein